MKKLLLICSFFILNLISAQKTEYERTSKYLDSIVSKADTIFIVFTKEINFVQSEVPIYEHQIDFNKFEDYDKKTYDTLADGRLISKNLPSEFDVMKKINHDSIQKVRKTLIFENSNFRNYNQLPFNTNKKLIGYEKRTCLNENNRAYENDCGGDSNYKIIFYHSYIKPGFHNKYIDYVKKRDIKYKKYDERYSRFIPVSGATGFTGIQMLDSSKNNLLFYIDTFYFNYRGNHKNKKIMLLHLASILKKNKVYYLKTGFDSNGKEDIFEEVTYQK